MFNHSHDPDQISQTFRHDDRVKVLNVLEPDQAASLATHIESKVQFSTVMTIGGETKVYTYADFQAMTDAQLADLRQQNMNDALRGVGYCYDGHMIAENNDPVLRRFLAFLNSPETIDRIRRITGDPSVRHADGQATRYRPGHFLTRHSDNIDGESRRFAYVFGFTRQWHPDWGGLLQFYQNDGTPREAWAPGFNVLSLFDVRHVHAVTYVTPFAGAARHSITGWFRA